MAVGIDVARGEEGAFVPLKMVDGRECGVYVQPADINVAQKYIAHVEDIDEDENRLSDEMRAEIRGFVEDILIGWSDGLVGIDGKPYGPDDTVPDSELTFREWFVDYLVRRRLGWAQRMMLSAMNQAMEVEGNFTEASASSGATESSARMDSTPSSADSESAEEETEPAAASG